MVKLVFLFRKPNDEAEFERYYVQNLVLLEKLPGIQRRQANMVLGSPIGESSYYRMLEFYFEDYTALDNALTSPLGTAAGQQVMGTVGHLVEMLFVDVFEDNEPIDPRGNQ